MQRDHQTHDDTAAGAALVLIGFVFLLDRLSGVVIRYTPGLQQVQQWWPLLLIGSGIVMLLWHSLRGREVRDGD